MKKIPIFLMLLLPIGVFGQEYYTFEVENEVSYTSIDPDSLIFKGKFHSETNTYLSFPFAPTNHLQLENDAILAGRKGVMDWSEGINKDGSLDLTVFGNSSFLDGKHLDDSSFIGYQVLSLEKDSVVKIEWKGLTYPNSEVNDSINFQLWFYKSGTIEYRYGGIKVANRSNLFGETSLTPRVILTTKKRNGSSSFDYFASFKLVNDPKDPDVVRYPNSNEYLEDIPPKGTVYRFIPQIFYTSLDEKYAPMKLNAFPNPAIGNLYFFNAHLSYPVEVRITNSFGQVKTIMLVSGENQVRLSEKGMLIVELQDAKGRSYSQKIISQ